MQTKHKSHQRPPKANDVARRTCQHGRCENCKSREGGRHKIIRVEAMEKAKEVIKKHKQAEAAPPKKRKAVTTHVDRGQPKKRKFKDDDEEFTIGASRKRAKGRKDVPAIIEKKVKYKAHVESLADRIEKYRALAAEKRADGGRVEEMIVNKASNGSYLYPRLTHLLPHLRSLFSLPDPNANTPKVFTYSGQYSIVADPEKSNASLARRVLALVGDAVEVEVRMGVKCNWESFERQSLVPSNSHSTSYSVKRAFAFSVFTPAPPTHGAHRSVSANTSKLGKEKKANGSSKPKQAILSRWFAQPATAPSQSKSLPLPHRRQAATDLTASQSQVVDYARQPGSGSGHVQVTCSDDLSHPLGIKGQKVLVEVQYEVA